MSSPRQWLSLSLSGLVLGLAPSVADAQTQAQTTATANAQPLTGTNLPAPRSDNDPQPRVATPVLPAGGLVSQAGVGGTTAYGRAGVLELGGHFGFNVASGQSSLTIAPSIGWFFADSLQVSGIVGYRFNRVSGSSAHSLQVLIEPSAHIPFTRTLFGFVGLGMGLSYVNGPGAGFALAPRIGLNVMVGRSGILSPAINFSYATNDVVQTNNGSLLAVSTSFGANVGYTVMW